MDKVDGENVTEVGTDEVKPLSMTEMIKNVIKTKAEITRKKLGIKFNVAKCKNLIAKKLLNSAK